MNHGDTTSVTASTAPKPGASHPRRLLQSRYQAHAPRKGATDITTGSVSPPKPLSAPNPAQCQTDGDVSICKATRNTRVISKVVSVVAHMKSAEKKIAYGKNAQAHPAQAAAPSPKCLFAMKYIGMHVRAENKQ